MKKFVSLFLAIITVAFLFAGCQPEVQITRGTIDGDVYKNDCLGFEFTKPKSWVYSTDEEIAAAMNIGVEQLGDENLKNALENTSSLYDMMVVDTITRSNINVGYENLSKSFSSNMTEEQYVDAMEEQMKNVSGMTVTFPEELEKAKLGETEFTRVVCTATVYNVSMTQIYYLRKIDGYMGYVIVTIPSGYEVSDIEAMFK